MSADDGRDGVLVLDSDGQAGTSVVRSLGRRNVPVTAGGPSRWSRGMLSRYSDDRYVLPVLDEDCSAFTRDLVRHLEASDYLAVFATTDRTSLHLARHKERLERTGTVVATEDWGTFVRAYDKADLFRLFDTLDVPSPETYAPDSLAGVSEIAEDVPYPAVVKPRSKSHRIDGAYETTLVSDEHYVDSPAELRQTYRELLWKYDRFDRQYPLVQEYVPGTTTTTVALADEGDVQAYFQEKRLRTYPSSGGNSALLTSVREPEMLKYVELVLDALDWTGPAMVEFMETPDGEFYVIEVNGRYWGSLPFAIESGVDFPWLHYRQLRGDDPSKYVTYGEYREDIVQRRLLYEDLKWFAENVADGDVTALWPFLRAFYRANHTFVSPEDPVPTVATLAKAISDVCAAAGAGVKELPEWVGRKCQSPRTDRT